MNENIFDRKSNIFRLSFDNLYIGVVTISKNQFVNCPAIDSSVFDEKDYIQYLAILEKCGDGFYQIDNNILCIQTDRYDEVSGFPKVTNPIKLSRFYKACYGDKRFPFIFSHLMIKSTRDRVIQDAKKKVLVI